jgi:hypothetical protein
VSISRKAGADGDEIEKALQQITTIVTPDTILRWHRQSASVTLVRGKAGVQMEIGIVIQGGRRHLPIVTLKHAA